MATALDYSTDQITPKKKLNPDGTAAQTDDQALDPNAPIQAVGNFATTGTTAPPPPPPTVPAPNDTTPSTVPNAPTLAPPPPPPPPPNGGQAPNPATDSAQPAAATAPTMSTAQWDAYSPLAGLTDAQKTAYWAGQGTGSLAGVGYTPPPITAVGSAVVDPSKEAAATETYKAANAQQIADVTKQVQGGQAAALGQVNAGQQAIDLDTAKKNAADNLAQAQAAGMQFTDQTKQAFLDAQMKGAGFDTAGNFIGAPEQNPLAVVGPAPTGTGTVQANNGYIDPATGKYVTPSGPATYLEGGKTYSDLGAATDAMNAQPKSETVDQINADTKAAIAKAAGDASTGTTPVPGVGANAGPSTTANTTAPTTPFGPGSDLQSTQINPTPSDRLDKLNTLADTAAQNVGGGQSRGQIAQQYLDAFDQAAQPQIRDQIRSVGQKAATFGRLGMGDTSVEALNPYTDYLTQRSAYAKQLAGDSASGDITDRLNNLQALDAAQGQTSNQDTSGRNELRTERQYQTTSAQTAIQNALEQWQAQEQAKNSQFGRDATVAGLNMTAAQQAQASAGVDWAALAKAIAEYNAAPKKAA